MWGRPINAGQAQPSCSRRPRSAVQKAGRTITPWCRGRPTMLGNTARGASSPANPAFTMPDPLSHTSALTSPSSACGSTGGAGSRRWAARCYQYIIGGTWCHSQSERGAGASGDRETLTISTADGTKLSAFLHALKIGRLWHLGGVQRDVLHYTFACRTKNLNMRLQECSTSRCARAKLSPADLHRLTSRSRCMQSRVAVMSLLVPQSCTRPFTPAAPPVRRVPISAIRCQYGSSHLQNAAKASSVVE